MAIYEHIVNFYGRDIEEFVSESGVADSAKAIRLVVDYEAADEGKTILEEVQALLNDAKVSEVVAIVIGAWEEAYDTSIQPVVDLLIDNKDKLGKLEALFVGEMTGEENEISWIIQADYSRLWNAFPKLQHLQIRGSMDLLLGEVKHENLKTLILETGGLGSDALDSVLACQLPELEHLELWLGDEGYGWDNQVSDLQPLLVKDRFAHLKTLGLRNAQEGDDLATLVATAPVVAQLEVLDLSLGTVGDIGAKALLASDLVKGLKKLDIHYHFISDELSKQLQQLPIEVDVSDPQQDDDGYRYVSVSE